MFFRQFTFLLYFSFPADIYSTENDEKQVKHEIQQTIEALYGIRGILFKPFMAFESAVCKQILQLETPVILGVDSIVDELSNAVRNCTKQVSWFTEFQHFRMKLIAVQLKNILKTDFWLSNISW